MANSDSTENAKYRALFEAMDVQAVVENLPGGAAFVVDRELRYQLAGGEALRTAGFQASDFVGKTLWEALLPDLADSYATQYRRGLAGETFMHEHEAHGRTYVSHGTPLRDVGGNVYAVLAVSYDISDLKRTEEERRILSREATLLAERNRMARDLHDTLAQGLTGIRLQLDAAEMALDEDTENRNTVKHHLNRARDIAQQSLLDARQSVRALRSPLLGEGSLPSALQRLAEQLTDSVRVEFQSEGTPVSLPNATENELYRIAQEAVTNALRHSGGHRIVIRLMYSAEQTRVSVRDDGRGFDPTAEREGFGIVGMQERAFRIGADLRIVSEADQGTEVSASV